MGLGQDSTALLYKYVYDPAFRKKYAPNDLLVIFSDTGNEYKETYQHLKFLMLFCVKHQIDFACITPDMGYHTGDWQSLPHFFETNKTIGSKVYRKICSQRLKIGPIYRYVEDYLMSVYKVPGGRKRAYHEFYKLYGKIRVIIGYAMKLSQHVFLKRNDLESTIQVTNTVIKKLEDGNGMVLFAEGTRSKDGVLKQFKKGAFQMAKAAKVRIVPVSIGNLHRFMPPSALMPIAPLRNIYIKIHPAISSDNKSVTELRAETWEAVNSGLPPYQQGVLSARVLKKLAAEQEQEQEREQEQD